jgi:hypothetical protein
MPTPVSVSCLIRRVRAADGHDQIGGLGGMFNGSPWHNSEANIIAEVEKPVSRRQWDYFVTHGDRELPIIVVIRGGRKCLATPADRDRSSILRSLPECPDRSATDVFTLPQGDAPHIPTVPGWSGGNGEDGQA